KKVARVESENNRKHFEALEKECNDKMLNERKKLEQQFAESFARRTAEIESALQERASKSEVIAEEERKQYARMLESRRAELEREFHEKEMGLVREKQDWESQRAMSIQKFEDEKKMQFDAVMAQEAKLKHDYEILVAKAKEAQISNDEEWDKRRI